MIATPPRITPDVGVAPNGQRLPPETRLGRVRLQVADVDRSLDWYQRILGLRLLDRDGPDARLGTHGSDEPLVILHGRPGVTPVPHRGRLGLYHFALLLPDRASLGAFLRHLASLGERAGASDHLVSEALYLNDPDGLGIEVYADRPRDTWRIQDGEIVMATQPLDTMNLAHAARHLTWTGMPEGTTIGHAHLHVGALNEASDFYHQTLGLDRVVWSYPGALFLSVGGYHHHLGLNTWSDGPSASEYDARLLDWKIVVPHAGDVAAAATRLSEAGHDVMRLGDGIRATDPWGTSVRIVPATPDAS